MSFSFSDPLTVNMFLHMDKATQGASGPHNAEGGQLKAIPLVRKDSVGPLVSKEFKYKKECIPLEEQWNTQLSAVHLPVTSWPQCPLFLDS